MVIPGRLLQLRMTSSFVAEIYKILCGPEWARAEAAFHKNPRSPHAIDRLQRAVHKSAGFAAVLRRNSVETDRELAKALDWYGELAARYGLHTTKSVCKFVLTFASQPHQVRRIFGPNLASLINEVKSKAAILRGARFLALLSANHGRILPVLPQRWE